MKLKTVLVMSVAMMLAAPAVYAADETPPQQQRMKDCNADAKKKELSGDARKEFMSKCLKGETAAATETGAATTQQNKMKTCNETAGKKKLAGDERKKFMSECLSADAPAAAEKKADTKEDKKGMTQQERMKSCNETAGKKKLSGDERKKFMSECLSAG